MRKATLIVLAASLISACGGHDAHPVPQFEPNDDYLNCKMIAQQIDQNNQSIYKLVPKTHKTGKNVALGVTGYFFIVPLFFMDFSDAEKVEIQSYQQRNNYLVSMGMRKHCKNLPAAVRVL